MTHDELRAIVEYAGGEKFILGFRFANGYKISYSPRGENDTSYRINLDKDLVIIAGAEFLKFEHHDFNGRPAYSLFPIDTIEQVYYMTEQGIRMRDIME